MSLRQELVHLVATQRVSMTELCQRFQISRKTGYKWVKRFRIEGEAGLADRSRRPHQVQYHVPGPTRQYLLAERQQHPAWGARKLRQRAQTQGLPAVPACSTITALLKREGLIVPRTTPAPHAWQRFEHPAPNDLWQMDFKGPIPTRTAPRQALTVLDDHSRFNLCLQALLAQTREAVQAALITVFRQYGLPNRLLTDNGSPWGHTGEQPYTVLTVWLIRVGIRISHSRPYHPQTMGKDERFHGSLNREVLQQAQWRDPAHLQQAFDRWRQVYNHDRPHEALELAVPATRYEPSLRAYPEILPPIEYDTGVTVRKVQQKGEVHFQGQVFEVSRAFRGYPVGLAPTKEDGIYEVRFCHHTIKRIDVRKPR
jgi:transposase InsO family protein